MTNFLKWLLITSVYAVTISVLESHYGFLGKMLEMDISYITPAIWFTFICGALWAMTQSFKSSPHLKRVGLLSSVCVNLGLLGSVIGIAITLVNLDLASADFTDKGAIIKMMGTVSYGMGISLVTTINGLIAALMLSQYSLFIKTYHD